MKTQRIRKSMNRTFVAAVAILMLLAMVSPLAYTLFHNRGTAEAAPANQPPEVSRQAINDADKEISFAFLSDEEVTEENFREYVKITDIAGACPPARFRGCEGGKFYVLP